MKCVMQTLTWNTYDPTIHFQYYIWKLKSINLFVSFTTEIMSLHFSFLCYRYLIWGNFPKVYHEQLINIVERDNWLHLLASHIQDLFMYPMNLDMQFAYVANHPSDFTGKLSNCWNSNFHLMWWEGASASFNRIALIPMYIVSYISLAGCVSLSGMFTLYTI